MGDRGPGRVLRATAREVSRTPGPPEQAPHDELLPRFRALVEGAVPGGATVAIVSRGDDELLELPDERRGWHFPQRADGVYAGYYPADSENAIAHLEAVRSKGAEFIAFPAAALWWLESYPEFGRHLDSCCRRIAHDDQAGAVYALAGARHAAALPATRPREKDDGDDPVAPEQLHALVDVRFYGDQVGMRFARAEDAVAHYLEVGATAYADPHPLFNTAWYLSRNEDARSSGESPLVHFLRHGRSRRLDPHPLFDAGHYYSQHPELHSSGTNALVHYVENALTKRAASPNPLFSDSFYLSTYRNVPREAATPLEHFVRHGAGRRRFGSSLHRNMFLEAQRTTSSLTRGMWQWGIVVLFTRGEPAGRDAFSALARLLRDEHRTGPLLVACSWPGRRASDGAGPSLVLEDYELAAPVFRESSLRLLARSLAALRPLFAVSDVSQVLVHLRAGGARSYAPADLDFSPGAMVELAARDPEVSFPRARSTAPGPTSRPKIVVPASDWAVSGVNVALEGVGRELRELGWDVEIVFTRPRESVLESADGEAHLPSLPHRFLERRKIGVLGMWEELIGDLESAAPRILLMSYDFLANGVAPALTESVGVVSWVQADDGDYYEQAYRLGPYCNAIVCVSEQIRQNVVRLNPSLGDRASVIHNSALRQADVAAQGRAPGPTMRLVYAGRLVQYQKRILDFVELARSLDRTGVPYEISLIGTFSRHEDAEQRFRELAREHLEDGRIKLRGRMAPAAVHDELTSHDFFLLLSDFEGLPLSLVEAMAKGCVPVVAQSRSGIAELIDDGENGAIVSGRDYGVWAELLVALWRDGERYGGMSSRARAKVRTEFSVERIGRQFAELFAAVADELATGTYRRPPSLNWGPGRSRTGDVLPPPSMHEPAAFNWV